MRKTKPAAAKPPRATKPEKPADLATRARKGKAQTKAAKVVALLMRKGGASRPEIAKAIRWQSMRRSTLKRMCAGKLKLREDKAGRFFASPRA